MAPLTARSLGRTFARPGGDDLVDVLNGRREHHLFDVTRSRGRTRAVPG